MKNVSINYIFYYPSKSIGGAQILFARLAEMLILNNENITILGPYDCYICLYLNKKKLAYNNIEISKTQPYYSGQNDVFILSLSYIIIFYKFIKPHLNSKMLFWDLHPYALIENLSFSKFYKNSRYRFLHKIFNFCERSFIKKLSDTILKAHSKEGVYFMCYRNFKTNDDLFHLNFKPSFLPLPISIKKNELNIRKNKNSICWISRLDSDKTPILRMLMLDIIEYNSLAKEKKFLHIIGHGNDFDEIKELAVKYKCYFRLAGIQNNELLSDYLQENQVAIGFAMGTSALEFASRNIETILVPSTTEYDFYKTKKNRYLPIYNVEGFDLAVESFHYGQNILCTFSEIINSYNSKEITDCYNYVVRAHSDYQIFDLVKIKLECLSFTFSDLLETGILKPNFFQIIKKIIKNL